MQIRNSVYIIFLSFLSFQTLAQTRIMDLESASDPRGPAELVVCSQNMDNYGTFKDVSIREGLSKAELLTKEMALVRRITKAKCDVVAVQEVLAGNEQKAEEVLNNFVKLLYKETLRKYAIKVGASNDPRLRNAFLVAENRARILNSVSYVNVELPKISENQKQRFFSRGPLEIQLEVQPLGESYPKVVTLVNFHFKSKSGKGGYDPTGLEFEPYRMEMSEALRRIIRNRHSNTINSAESVLMLLGDRNSHFDSASAKILTGQLKLSDFQGKSACRLSKRGVPLCKPDTAKPPILTSVLITNELIKNFPGTIRYKDTVSWIDEILLTNPTLPYAWTEEQEDGRYSSGVIYEPKEASDHALVWVKLNW